MRASDLDYDLPPERIAQEPLPERSGSRLLHVGPSGGFAHRSFREFPRLLRAGDVVVLNETKVVPARLGLRRRTGGAVEVLLVRPESGMWRALLRPARRLREGEILEGAGGAFSVRLHRIERDGALVEIEGASTEEIFEKHGQVPLPPYVRREARAEDRERYQTVYARVPGAVAAPTAGLHFDERILAGIQDRGVRIARLVLHVGPGTFRPLPEGELGTLRIEPERYTIPAETLAALADARTSGGRVVAVGTTVVRALETEFAPGLRREPRPGESLRETRLFIYPPYEFRAVDALLTNFHLPRSSLLCLTAAFVGTERILSAYREAVKRGYRFYSYGDATFLERPE